MKKESFYFSHDYNARNDYKCLYLRQQLGMEGYGIYWFLIESLAEGGGKLPLKIIPVLAMQMQVQDVKVSAVINSFDLFTVSDDYFFSMRLNEHLNKRNKLSESGAKGAEKRWGIKNEKVKQIAPKEDAKPSMVIGVNYRPAYDDTPDEFKSLYSKEFYNSWLDVNKHIDENCKYLRDWDNQLTIAEFKKLYDKIIKREITVEQVSLSLVDLAGSRPAKDKYNSVSHGLNVFLRTLLRR